MEHQITSLKNRTRSLEERLDQHYEDLRNAKFTGAAAGQIAALAARVEDDKLELQSIARETDQLVGTVDEVKRDNQSLEAVILSTATAVLGLTVTFSGNLIPEQPNAILCLILAWIFLTGTIISFPIGSLINIFARVGVLHPRVNGYKISGAMSGLGFCCFITGIIWFLAFAILNIPIPAE